MKTTVARRECKIEWREGKIEWREGKKDNDRMTKMKFV